MKPAKILTNKICDFFNPQSLLLWSFSGFPNSGKVTDNLSLLFEIYKNLNLKWWNLNQKLHANFEFFSDSSDFIIKYIVNFDLDALIPTIFPICHISYLPYIIHSFDSEIILLKVIYLIIFDNSVCWIFSSQKFQLNLASCRDVHVVWIGSRFLVGEMKKAVIWSLKLHLLHPYTGTDCICCKRHLLFAHV